MWICYIRLGVEEGARLIAVGGRLVKPAKRFSLFFGEIGRCGSVPNSCLAVGGRLVRACGELCFELAELGCLFFKRCGEPGIQLA